MHGVVGRDVSTDVCILFAGGACSPLALVVGGLIDIVSFNKNGLASTLFNVQTFTTSLNIIYKIVEIPEKKMHSFVQVFNLKNTWELETNGMALHYIAYSREYTGNVDQGLNVTAKRIGKEGNPYDVHIFKTSNSVYFKTAKLGGNVFFIGSNIRVTAVESLPEDAEEVNVF